MNPCQYIIIQKGCGMSTGKVAAQAAHASIEGLRISANEGNAYDKNPWDEKMVNLWYKGGHYMKVVLETHDSLHTVSQYLSDRGIENRVIIDEGRTEFDGHMTATAIGTEIVDKDNSHVKATMEQFRLYSDPEAVPPSDERTRRDHIRRMLGR